MRPRLTPSFLVAVLALLVAVGGTGYAAGLITSRDIKDGTITGRDMKDGAITGRDIGRNAISGPQVRDGSLRGTELAERSVPRSKLAGTCAAGEVAAFGGCLRPTPGPASSYDQAVTDCSRRNGRLPSLQELRWIASQDDITWADGDDTQYEFSGDFTTQYPFTPIAHARYAGYQAGNDAYIYNATFQTFWHHCITY